MSIPPLGRRSALLNTSFAVLFAAMLAFAGACYWALSAIASEEEHEVEISIKDHKFTPEELKLPTGKPIRITVKNLDGSAEEIESKDLGFEKVIAGNSDGTVRLKPLEAGTYIFYGEYHEDTAQGHIIAE